MFARHRFTLALIFVFGLQLGVVGLAFLLVRLDMDESQRALLDQALASRGMLLAAAALLVLLFLGISLRALFGAYLAPIERLAEDMVLLATNPSHRATPQGAPEARLLAEKFNALAASHQALHNDVRARIDAANRALTEEKNRLAALMSELALGVLACNIEGRILLYNARAKQLFAASQRDGSPAATVAIGLGRSIFGAIERGLILHALEQIQYQLSARSDPTIYPVSGFVATLADDRIVHAHMAPVLDEAQTLVGFVLTLEDITRHIETDSRRDALLQSLTEEARSALANIRAAVETMQAFPGMDDAKRARFAAVIEEESQRLTRRIEYDARQYGGDRDGNWQLEEMRGADLLALLLRRIGSTSIRVTTCNTADAVFWLRADSYALTQALGYLAQKLCGELGVNELCIGLQRAGRLAHLDIAWNGAPLAAETMRAWENTPMQIGAAGSVLTLSAVIARHGGESVYRSEAPRYRLLLPVTERQATFELPMKQQGRPEFYDFDLFHQPGQNTELDQSLLSQLIYTVFDTETTGLQPAEGDEIISIGALRIVNGRLLHQESFEQLVRPRHPLSEESIGVHGITHNMLVDQPLIETVLPQFHRFAEGTVLIAHNAAFDMRFLQMQEERTGVRFTQPVLDTLLLSQVVHPHQQQHTLEAIAARLGVAIIGRHTALGDAIVAGEVFLRIIPLLAEKGIRTLKEARGAAEKTLYARIHY